MGQSALQGTMLPRAYRVSVLRNGIELRAVACVRMCLTAEPLELCAELLAEPLLHLAQRKVVDRELAARRQVGREVGWRCGERLRERRDRMSRGGSSPGA